MTPRKADGRASKPAPGSRTTPKIAASRSSAKRRSGARARPAAGADALDAWFDARGWEPLPFQRETWEAYAAGRSGLVHAPTGTGKTLAVWGGPLREALADDDGGDGLRVLWITPLRALAADTTARLQEAVDGVGLDWAVARRTGDTGSGERARQRKRLPPALVTTPESLSLLLTDRELSKRFGGLRALVVDEWHELMGSKRGVQLELCLARLRALAPEARTWGLSATLGNLEQARDVLLGPSRADDGVLVSAPIDKPVRITSVIPERMDRFPWAGHLGTRLLPAVIERLESAATSLLFTNTRSQAEIWHRELLAARPDWEQELALHHGSIDAAERRAVEEGLAAGRLRCVVCTSSLDLGVDFTPVEQVLQVGSPKGVARLVQRAGRSGHQPGRVSEVLCVPSHAFELVEIAAARRAHEAGRIEARAPLVDCLDVLAQHLVTLAVGDGFEPDALRAEVMTTHAFAGLTDDAWRWTLDFVVRGGQALQGYPDYRRVVRGDDGVHRVTEKRLATRHRMSIGTITSDAMMSVRWVSGGRLGSVEESFLARLKPGDRFLFSGRTVELARVRDLTAYVRKAPGGQGSVPRWQGGRMPLSSRLADAVLDVLGVGEGLLDAQALDERAAPELAAVAPMLALQRTTSRLPDRGTLLVEQVTTREGVSTFLFPFAGRLVHEGLALLLAWRVSQERPCTYTLAVNDYGLELLGDEPAVRDEDDLRRLLSTDDLLEHVLACTNTTEAARRRFRDIARIAGLVFGGYPGRGKSARQVQASSGLIFDVLEKYDEGNLLLDQARREVLERQLELERLRDALERVASQRVVLAAPERLTPLAFPLWAERLQSTVVSSERWKDRVMKMAARLERAADRALEAGGAGAS